MKTFVLLSLMLSASFVFADPAPIQHGKLTGTAASRIFHVLEGTDLRTRTEHEGTCLPRIESSTGSLQLCPKNSGWTLTIRDPQDVDLMWTSATEALRLVRTLNEILPSSEKAVSRTPRSVTIVGPDLDIRYVRCRVHRFVFTGVVCHTFGKVPQLAE